MDAESTDRSAQPAAGSGGSKRALLIGVDGYQSVTPLEGCVNDIIAIRRFLIDQAGWRAGDIQVLAAPPEGTALPADVGAAPAPTRDNILAAFDRLGQQSQAHDQVVIYYSGHGVRLGAGPGTLTGNPDPNAPAYHISAICPVDTEITGLNLVLNRELNSGVNRLITANATVTVVFDCCHSGGVASRDLGPQAPGAPAVREVVLDPKQIDWARVRQQYGLDGGEDPGQRGIASGGGGWVPTPAQSAELIVVSGCRDVEVSHEYTPADQRHGALTYFLLDALQQASPGQVAALRWADLYPGVRNNVNSQFPDQTPTLEGRAERPVFGGQWRPYAPGFSVSTGGPGGRLTLNGGTIHGLGPGAQVAIYPPGTASFAEADRNQVPRLLAEVDAATPVSSQAHVVAGDAGRIEEGARALLLRPSTGRPSLLVGLAAVPEDIRSAIAAAPEAAGFLNLNPGQLAPAVEVCSWERNNQKGWTIVKAKVPSATNPVSENDVVGFLPTGALAAAAVGGILARGLVQWARYRSVVDRRNDDPQLKGMLQLVVLASTDRTTLISGGAASGSVRLPDATGVVRVRDNESLLLRVRIAPQCPDNLHVAILLASDEGNIAGVYDTGLNTLPPGEDAPVGLGGPQGTFKLPVSAWQTASQWVFKAIATDADHPFDVAPLTLDDTVQDLLTAQPKALPAADVLPDVRWTTIEVPVVVTRH